MHTSLQHARGFQNFLRVRLHNLIMQETVRSHPKSYISKAVHRKYKRLELGSGQAYDGWSGRLTNPCLTNPISQPNLDISPIWIPLISNEVSTHREDLYDGTDSSWISIKFQSRVFRFYSTDGASDRYYMSLQIFLFPFLCIGTHALGSVG
jgi:hypothetical protein